MTLDYKYLLTFCILSILTTVLFVGQFYDHHGDRTLFIKHRPTFRQMFNLPSKDQHQSVKKTIEEKLEEDANEEFILKSNLQESHGNIIMPSILFQISIMLLVCTFFSFYKRTSLFYWQLMLQFSTNILITVFGIFYMLWDDNSMTSAIWFVILVTTNYLTIFFLDRLKNRSKEFNDKIAASTTVSSS